MFFHLLYIHLFRPFLKYNPSTSPLPSHVSPRKLCTQAAASVSKLMRLYKRTYGLRQICNIAVYIVHSACTIHLLNLPEKTAKRDIIHGVKHLEEIAEDWLCARRTLSILSVLARKWKIDLPEEAAQVFTRTDAKFGFFSTADVPSPKQELVVATPPSAATSPPRVPQPQLVNPPKVARSQNQLQQSLYSYLPDAQPIPMNGVQRPPSNLQNSIPNNPAPNLSSGSGSMTVPTDTVVSSVPYTRNVYSTQSTSTSRSGVSELPRTSSTESSGQMTRQVSPNTLFGGVEALVESQDWWLRDQASLAVGFDNWMGIGQTEDLTGTGGTGSPELANMTGVNSEFYMPPRSDGYGGAGGGADDDWVYN
jgi:hypothetical protein